MESILFLLQDIDRHVQSEDSGDHLIDSSVGPIDLEHVLEPLLLFPEILFQEGDDLLCRVVLAQPSDIHDPFSDVVFIIGEIFLSGSHGFLVHAASSINQSLQGFLKAHPLHFQLLELSLGMKTPLEIPL